MRGTPRFQGLAALALLALTSGPLSSVAFAAPQDADVQEAFNRGVAALQRGDDEAALEAFQEVLALDPSNVDAYELWRTTDNEIWLDMMTRQGQLELVAKRLLELAEVRRGELSRDTGEINEKVGQLASADGVQRRALIAQLRSLHGEFAVARMLAPLAEEGRTELRVAFMASLAEMGPVAVPPLLEALRTSNAFQRRNLAFTLGNLGDRRAVGDLALLAQSDPDEGVREAAAQSLGRLGASGANASDALCNLGEAYLNGVSTVADPTLRSAVVWSWNGGRLEPTDVPSAVYLEEMAKRSFYRALAADPDSMRAQAGLVRASVQALANLEAAAEQGADVDGAIDNARTGLLAAYVAGPAALDRAIVDALSANDASAASALLSFSVGVLRGPSAGISQGLASRSVTVRDEAAVAAAHAVLAAGAQMPQNALGALGEAATREIRRTVLVIDGDAARSEGVTSVVEGRGHVVAVTKTGATGLATFNRLPAVDAVLVADSFSDLTTFQVLQQLRERGGDELPVFVLSSDADRADELYGDWANGVVTAGEDMGQLDEALAGDFAGARGRAQNLAQRAAEALAALSAAGRDVSAVSDQLLDAGHNQGDAIAIPALTGLAASGAPRHGQGLVDIAADSGRSDEVRTAAADALAAINIRGSVVASAENYETLSGALADAGSAELRGALARALGAWDLDGTARQRALRTLRVTVSE
jgi:CheY-like chemotaxis protein